MSYLGRILVAIDQLGNTVAGGNPDCTISGRTGYYANHAVGLTRWYWVTLQAIINFTFYPLDGPDHCHYAYHNDDTETYRAPSAILMFILSLITTSSCLILVLPLYILWVLKIVEPKRGEGKEH